TLLGFLPPWVPFAALAVLLLGLAGGFFALKASWQAERAANVIAADQKAEIATLQDKAQTVITRIVNAPSTSGCGPVMRDASHGVRELFDGAGGKDAG